MKRFLSWKLLKPYRDISTSQLFHLNFRNFYIFDQISTHFPNKLLLCPLLFVCLSLIQSPDSPKRHFFIHLCHFLDIIYAFPVLFYHVSRLLFLSGVLFKLMILRKKNKGRIKFLLIVIIITRQRSKSKK